MGSVSNINRYGMFCFFLVKMENIRSAAKNAIAIYTEHNLSHQKEHILEKGITITIEPSADVYITSIVDHYR